MAYRADAAVRDTYRVLRELADSRELLEELRGAEAAFNRFASSSPRRPEGEYEELLPWLLDQAADFEAAAAAGAPAAPPLLLESPPRYRLFDASRGGCAGCARALLRAAKTQSVNRDLQAAASECIHAVLPVASLPEEEAGAAGPAADVGDLPRAGHWQDLRYRGDWMLRPIASNEVGWLARLLVSISRSINSACALDGVPLRAPAPAPAPAPGAAPAGGARRAGAAPGGQEQPETLLQEWLLVARRRGWRVNLRPLAEKQTLAWLLAAALLLYWTVLWLASPPREGGGWGDAAAEAPAGGQQQQQQWQRQWEQHQQERQQWQQQYEQQQQQQYQQQRQQPPQPRVQQWQDVPGGGPADLGAW
ncbi:hypothetical protein MNEG_7603 [Monoraphidium neglectum]|uniref:Uncharacterized protein n=1 Tax=Monoraphidium neglectum TaxID=145388 RepID=A0A0D2MI28_9CHLO|nr:hypothetical protein MNEG_7603 [Monoraphidium neglectum]KIZ00357.1 hypothetical protein MNEG_7603 [Monoraphidium neglectum]|eukprot:XP_013899376.1 hypothetical protein MNEG_7603 [Monoraphidium neglectum]